MRFLNTIPLSWLEPMRACQSMTKIRQAGVKLFSLQFTCYRIDSLYPLCHRLAFFSNEINESSSPSNLGRTLAGLPVVSHGYVFAFVSFFPLGARR
jgi:hypothetical protein